MKRVVRSLIASAFIMAPASAGAVDCSIISNPHAVSQHYVQKVLDRAAEGIAKAKEAKAPEDFFPLYFHGWARSIGGTLAQVIDSRQRLTERTGDLITATACLRYDQILIECSMERVRKEMDAQLERGSFFAIMQLQSVMLFLQDRYAHLSFGAADGSYADETWEQKRLFDREKPEELPGPLCPFYSDYTPPRMTGYGCDVSIMQSLSPSVDDGQGFVHAELQALRTIEEEIDEFRSIVPLLQEATSGSSGGSSYPPVSEREHLTIIGCQEETGSCSDDSSLVCGSDEFCASKGKGTCLRDATSPTIPKRSLRGPFSYPTDHLGLLQEFIGKRIEDGLSRTFSPRWARTEDLPKDGDDAKKRQRDDAILTSARTGLRIYFRSMSGIQGREEGSIFPEASDAQLEMAQSLSDMRASIGELSRLSNEKNGVRGFVIDLAYFLRRTCAFRPCQKSLEQVIRISMADECFPYTNGEFLGDSEGNPRWKQCARAACIQVDDEKGNPIELPRNCDEILPQ